MDSTADATSQPKLPTSFARGVDFGECLQAQLAAREALAAGEGPPRLFMVEHTPALTLGRRATRSDVLWSDAQLAAMGMGVYDTPRGGEATLHAPGQLVAYPVVHVGRQIRAHIVRLAEVSIALLGELGIDNARFDMEHPGVWVDRPPSDHDLRDEKTPARAKIASIGIHVSRGVTVQGLSLNLDVDARLFQALVSCGMPSVELVSAKALATQPWPGFDALARRWASLYAEAAGYTIDVVD